MAKGTVEGGYVDQKRLRIKIWKERKDLEAEAEKCQSQALEVQSEINNVEKELKGILDVLQKTDRLRKGAMGEEAEMTMRLDELKRKVCLHVHVALWRSVTRAFTPCAGRLPSPRRCAGRQGEGVQIQGRRSGGQVIPEL